jgi:tyrosine-protein phosphatase YwqE
MDRDDYHRLHDMGCYLQMNLPSIVGFYGGSARERAMRLLEKGWYVMAGSDCHRFKALQGQYAAKELKKDTIDRLELLMGVSGEI